MDWWQAPFIEHPEHEHPQEQDDLPFFLSTIDFATIPTNTATTINKTTNVGTFIRTPPNYFVLIFEGLFSYLFFLKSIYKINTRTTAATTVPITLPVPLNQEPNW